AERDPNGRPPGRLDERQARGEKPLHLHGSSSEPVRQHFLYDVADERDHVAGEQARDAAPMIAALTSAAFGVWLAAAGTAPTIFANQVAYDPRGPKLALIQTDAAVSSPATATVIDDATSAVRMTLTLSDAGRIDEWTPGTFYYTAVFSALQKAG